MKSNVMWNIALWESRFTVSAVWVFTLLSGAGPNKLVESQLFTPVTCPLSARSFLTSKVNFLSQFTWRERTELKAVKGIKRWTNETHHYLEWYYRFLLICLFVWNILDNVGTQLKTLVSQQMGNLNRQTDQGGLRQKGRRWGKVQVKHSHWATSLSRQKQLQFNSSMVKKGWLTKREKSSMMKPVQLQMIHWWVCGLRRRHNWHHHVNSSETFILSSTKYSCSFFYVLAAERGYTVEVSRGGHSDNNSTEKRNKVSAHWCWCELSVVLDNIVSSSGLRGTSVSRFSSTTIMVVVIS